MEPETVGGYKRSERDEIVGALNCLSYILFQDNHAHSTSSPTHTIGKQLRQKIEYKIGELVDKL